MIFNFPLLLPRRCYYFQNPIIYNCSFSYLNAFLKFSTIKKSETLTAQDFTQLVIRGYCFGNKVRTTVCFSFSCCTNSTFEISESPMNHHFWNYFRRWDYKSQGIRSWFLLRVYVCMYLDVMYFQDSSFSKILWFLKKIIPNWSLTRLFWTWLHSFRRSWRNRDRRPSKWSHSSNSRNLLRLTDAPYPAGDPVF